MGPGAPLPGIGISAVDWTVGAGAENLRCGAVRIDRNQRHLDRLV